MDHHPRTSGQYRGMKKSISFIGKKLLPALGIILLVMIHGAFAPNERQAVLYYLGYPESVTQAILQQEEEVVQIFLEQTYLPYFDKVYQQIQGDGIFKTDEISLLRHLQQTYPKHYLDQKSLDFFFELIKIPEWETFFDYPLPLTFLDSFPIQPNMMELSQEEIYIIKHPYIPVLMYHKLDNSKQWIDEKSFMWQLEQLEKAGFSTIRADAFMKADFSAIPEGRKPILLTFDDGRYSQFQLLENGKTDPKTGVGMLESFAEKYPAFGKNAVFYLYFTILPFENVNEPMLWKSKISYLQDQGFEIGNHTYDHQILTKFRPEQVKKTLDQFYQVLETIPQCRIDEAMTLCYPGGGPPRDRSGVEQYKYKDKPLLGAFTAWGGKSLIPIHPKADRYNLPRYDANDEHVRQIVKEDFFQKTSQRLTLPRYFTTSVDTIKLYLKENTSLLQHDLIWNGHWIGKEQAQETENK